MRPHDISEHEESPGAAPLALDLRSVCKRFGAQTALQDVTWSVPRGHLCGLLGPNGAGKTTLFRLLMGILRASSGSLQIGGLDAFRDRVALKRQIGFLPDEPIFYSYLTGGEILELSASLHGLDPGETLARLAPLIAELQLADALPRFADEYSRGMKKKLGLLLALLHQPRLLILDEPTNGLDVESTRVFFARMKQEAQRGTTVLFSSHLIDQVERLCSHVAILREGHLRFAGSLSELRERHGSGGTLEDVFVALGSRS